MALRAGSTLGPRLCQSWRRSYTAQMASPKASTRALLVLGVERGSQLAKAQGLSAIFVLREGDELREITVGL